MLIFAKNLNTFITLFYILNISRTFLVKLNQNVAKSANNDQNSKINQVKQLKQSSEFYSSQWVNIYKKCVIVSMSFLRIFLYKWIFTKSDQVAEFLILF